MRRTWRFTPDDTWFFRPSRSHSPVGASILASRFPPPARTLAGAIRYLMGESTGRVDWRAFGRAEGSYAVGGVDLRAEMGRGLDYGKLDLTGPFLATRIGDGSWERLFPCPALLARSFEGKLVRFEVGEAEETDLGRVRLPTLAYSGSQPLEERWLRASDYELILAGAVPEPSRLVAREQLVAEEPRLGIVKSLESRTAVEGLLYQTRHLRPRCAVAVEVEVGGVDPRLQAPRSTVRLGGEGRLAGVELDEPAALPAAPEPRETTTGLCLILLTEADLEGRWLPVADPRPERTPAGEQVWRGELCGVSLVVHSGILGRAVREGGWDLAARAPAAARSLVPAGSLWWCTVEKEGRKVSGSALAPMVEALHLAQLQGPGKAIGRGLLAAALWTDSQAPEERR